MTRYHPGGGGCRRATRRLLKTNNCNYAANGVIVDAEIGVKYISLRITYPTRNLTPQYALLEVVYGLSRPLQNYKVSKHWHLNSMTLLHIVVSRFPERHPSPGAHLSWLITFWSTFWNSPFPPSQKHKSTRILPVFFFNVG